MTLESVQSEDWEAEKQARTGLEQRDVWRALFLLLFGKSDIWTRADR